MSYAHAVEVINIEVSRVYAPTLNDEVMKLSIINQKYSHQNRPAAASFVKEMIYL